MMLEARISSRSTEMLMVLKVVDRSRATIAVQSAGFCLLKSMLIFCTMAFSAVVVEVIDGSHADGSPEVDVLGPLAEGVFQRALPLGTGEQLDKSFWNYPPM